MTTLLLVITGLHGLFATTLLADESVDHWSLDPHRVGEAIRPLGDVEFGRVATGQGARPQETVVVLQNAMIDAGNRFQPRVDRFTLHVRLLDRAGAWNRSLVSQDSEPGRRGFRLAGIDVPTTPGPDVRFEMRTDHGVVTVEAALATPDPGAWHDLVARYDGTYLQLICDGRILAQRRWRGRLLGGEQPLLIGGDRHDGNADNRFTGELQTVSLWSRALSDQELVERLHVKQLTPLPLSAAEYRSPVHYRPPTSFLHDTIPFFWNGEYHLFYLLNGQGGTPWAHVKTRNFLDWEDLPIALPRGGPKDPDGENVFTGSVVEHEGLFHAFYTGWNTQIPCREQIMRATSPDLIHWTKHPADTFAADGRIYQNEGGKDFRDPFVRWDAANNHWQMLFCARDGASGDPVVGQAVSTDLVKWQFMPPLCRDFPGPPECPDLFQIGDTWYLIASPSTDVTTYRWARNPDGPWSPPADNLEPIDTPVLYAAKRMFDGKRHILHGWLRDYYEERDIGFGRWGGILSLPREVFEIEPGRLGTRPAPEVRTPFVQTIFTLANLSSIDHQPSATQSGMGWQQEAGRLTGRAGEQSERIRLKAPAHYHLDCEVKIDKQAVFALGFRRHDADASGYQLVIDPANQKIGFVGPDKNNTRHCRFSSSEPIRIEAFVQGTVIECFINDRYAFSGRAYDYPTGTLDCLIRQGTATLTRLQLRTHQLPNDH